ncbi:hypothetical protein HYPSUDRAFT_144149 [Hypholoma sublateritium FD-334 SS-4]|uniref:Cytochrome P450 n=1 Tax=Hypholoma sublateritium (strain FD-334 SS-4) TaxID=945553 RepID=A0A0D2KX31_HYPSF|nr:hypothetical protein HYPSUDRAFT_144149 [Hypholoma sublateritium FD-334 SS-4]
MGPIQALGLLSISWALWKLLRHRVLPSSLDNIPGPASESFLTGVFSKLFDTDAWAYQKSLHRTYGNTIRIHGILGEKELYTYDPKAMHHIFVKDQSVFEETDQFIQLNNLIFGPGILATLGEQHRKQRKMLNPIFSIAHLRGMTPIFYKITHKLQDAFLKKVQNGPQEIEIVSWMTRTALELVCQSGLGHSFDTLEEDTAPHPYSIAVKTLVPKVANPMMRYATAFLLPLVSGIGSASFRRWAVNTFPWKNLHDVRDVVDILHSTSVNIFESKKEAMANGGGTGLSIEEKDIMSILMKANMTASTEESLSRDELIGQMSSLMFAAMDTTSSALSRLLQLLSLHQDVQDKLRKEINDAFEAEPERGDLPYDKIVSLPYLDAICRETLRLHSPVIMARRVARRDIVLPLMVPIKGLDGREISEVYVSKGTNVTIGLLASNTNPALWGADADEWKPERWLSPLPDEVIAAHLPGVYANLMTFIAGSRACIGFKFSQLEMKVVLALLIQAFRFSPSKAEIAWKIGGIVVPTVVGGDKNTPQLPIIVEKI